MINIFSDPHIGTRRQAHTTTESSKRLQREIKTAAQRVVMDHVHDNDGQNLLICAGDLFDHANNSEAVLVDGYNIARQCDKVLSGNHDESGRQGVVTTLQALDRAFEDNSPIAARPEFDSVHVHSFWDEATQTTVHMVPHHATQAQFSQALEDAEAALHPKRKNLLILHCTYDSPWTDGQGADNNLTKERAAQLLEHFDLVLLGHEHIPNSHFDGRLMILGNTHPTSFADMSSKYRYQWDGNNLSRHLIWDEDERSLDLRYGESDLDAVDWSKVQFVDVRGSAGADSGPEIAKFINRIWKRSDQLLMVRSSVVITDHLSNIDTDRDAPAMVDLSQRVASDLEKSDLLPVWQEIVREISV